MYYNHVLSRVEPELSVFLVIMKHVNVLFCVHAHRLCALLFVSAGYQCVQAEWIYNGSAEMLLNPDRGFRYELDSFPDMGKLAEHCKEYNLTVSQIYCYLDDFIGKPLPTEKLVAITAGFSTLRALGVKALLRFAYERTTQEKAGPTFDDIFNHVASLALVVKNNTDVIYAVQVGLC